MADIRDGDKKDTNSIKGITIATSVFALAFGSWAFVVKYAADTTAEALKEQSKIMQEMLNTQIELRERLTRAETKLEVLERELDNI